MAGWAARAASLATSLVHAMSPRLRAMSDALGELELSLVSQCEVLSHQDPSAPSSDFILWADEFEERLERVSADLWRWDDETSGVLSGLAPWARLADLLEACRAIREGQRTEEERFWASEVEEARQRRSRDVDDRRAGLRAAALFVRQAPRHRRASLVASVTRVRKQLGDVEQLLAWLDGGPPFGGSLWDADHWDMNPSVFEACVELGHLDARTRRELLTPLLAEIVAPLLRVALPGPSRSPARWRDTAGPNAPPPLRRLRPAVVPNGPNARARYGATPEVAPSGARAA